MSKREIFKYKIEFLYTYKDKILTFNADNVSSIIIDYNYDNKHSPILILKASVDANLVDDMIDNVNKKNIILKISKFVTNTKFPIDTNYIYDEFSFIVSEDKNKKKDLDYPHDTQVTSKTNQPRFRDVTIGLIKMDIINNNKKSINGIFKDTTLLDIICYYAKDMNLLIEPLKENTICTNFIIPPLDSFSKLIYYIDNNCGLYDTEYRLFYDYDKTYLLSSSGNQIKSNDEYLSSVIININKTTNLDSKLLGMETDVNRKAYVIDVDINDCNIFRNDASPISYNKTVHINKNGNNNYNDLDMNDKIKIDFVQRQNINPIKETEVDTIINIFKTDLDTSIFTLNKEYNIKDFTDNTLTGNYILIKKKEIYTKEGKVFILSNMLTFKKINPST